jgi:putative endopeptidase
MRNRLLRLLLISLPFVISCNDNKEVKNSESKKDILAADLDTTVSPREDFFEYANGGWIKANPIPADQSGWGIGNLVLEENRKRFREINEKAAATSAAKELPIKRSVISGKLQWTVPK